jgi:hypothetical protein
MVVKLHVLFNKIGLRKKVIGYIKDKGAMITSLKVIVSCENFGLEEFSKTPFLGIPCQRPINMVQ